jgi:hypothetical protein
MSKGCPKLDPKAGSALAFSPRTPAPEEGVPAGGEFWPGLKPPMDFRIEASVFSNSSSRLLMLITGPILQGIYSSGSLLRFLLGTS